MEKNVPLKYFFRTIPILIILLIFSGNVNSQVTVSELQEHIKFLSSDSLKGRLTGSPGDSLAAEYIKNNNITIFFENTDEYFLELGEEVVVFKIREDGNFDFSEKKWIGNKKTTKMIDE